MFRLSCSTCNGWDLFDATVTRRVTGVDLNPSASSDSVSGFKPGLRSGATVRRTSRVGVEPDAFELAHAALVYEYVDWLPLMPRLAESDLGFKLAPCPAPRSVDLGPARR